MRRLFLLSFVGLLDWTLESIILSLSFVHVFLFSTVHDVRLEAKTSQITSTSPNDSEQSQHPSSRYCTFS